MSESKKPVYNKESQAKIGPVMLENSKKRKEIFKEPAKKVGRVKIIPAHMTIFQHYKDQGFRSLGKAIRKTGVYSEGVADRVTSISSTKSWQAILDMYLPEDMLAFRHAELLNKRDTETVYDMVETKKVDKDGKPIMKKVARLIDKGPETNAVSKGLELGYRLRGSFSKDDTPATPANVYNLFYNPEVRMQVANFEAGIKQTLLNEINKKNRQENARETGKGPVSSGDDGGGTEKPGPSEEKAG